MISTIAPVGKMMNSSVPPHSFLTSSRKRRVTIVLPHSLLERLRNAVYWTGHCPLASLISDALDQAVTRMEHTNGQTFPQRLTPLKPGRPRKTPGAGPLRLSSAVMERIQ